MISKILKHTPIVQTFQSRPALHPILRQQTCNLKGKPSRQPTARCIVTVKRKRFSSVQFPNRAKRGGSQEHPTPHCGCTERLFSFTKQRVYLRQHLVTHGSSSAYHPDILGSLSDSLSANFGQNVSLSEDDYSLLIRSQSPTG